MDNRRSELSKLRSYIQRTDSEVTMILQSLQWDRKNLIGGLPMVSCKYDLNHKVPPDRLHAHERSCRLRSEGYPADEQLLPEPLDACADTLVTLNKDDITNIIDYAAKIDPLFRKGRGPEEWQPLTLERLQEAYSADERRALHDAVARAAPCCRGLLEPALPGDGGAHPAAQGKSRAAILAELRDMKRRRTKYRGAAKTRNYSDALRDLIATQMEHYSDSQAAVSGIIQSKDSNTDQKAANSKQCEEVHVKKESDGGEESRLYSRDHVSRQRDTRDKHKERDREKRHDDHRRDKNRNERDTYSSSSKERSRNTDDYRSGHKYRKDDDWDSSHSKTREYRDGSKSLRHSDFRERRERCDRYDSYERPHRQDRYTRYDDSKQDDFEPTKKRIKREKE